MEKKSGSKKLSLFHLNIRSSRQDKLNDMMCYLETIESDFSIISLSENWGKSYNIEMRTIPGYKHLYYIRPDSTRGGGVNIYI